MSGDHPLGILELTGKGAGFIRRREANYLPSNGDVHIGQRLVRRYGLRTGDEISGSVGKPPGPKKGPPLTRLTAVNGQTLDAIEGRPEYSSLGAIHPKEQLVLDCDLRRLGDRDYTNWTVDLLCPIGKGQRAMIVAPAKAGKTMVLQAIAQGITTNYQDATLFILLVDERPEEVTEMESCGFGEVVASSFDFPAQRHIAVAELTIERARRRVELGEEVVLILDSITRLARAYNTVERGSGRTLSGGLDATSMEKPKRFLGSARKIAPAQGGGALTIIGTALVDTGSRMDQVIYEEFKGTGNSELVLNREIADRRLFPAIDLNASATRREELLLSPDALHASGLIRRRLANLSPPEAMSELLTMMKQHKSLSEFISEVNDRE